MPNLRLVSGLLLLCHLGTSLGAVVKLNNSPTHEKRSLAVGPHDHSLVKRAKVEWPQSGDIIKLPFYKLVDTNGKDHDSDLGLKQDGSHHEAIYLGVQKTKSIMDKFVGSSKDKLVYFGAIVDNHLGSTANDQSTVIPPQGGSNNPGSSLDPFEGTAQVQGISYEDNGTQGQFKNKRIILATRIFSKETLSKVTKVGKLSEERTNRLATDLLDKTPKSMRPDFEGPLKRLLPKIQPLTSNKEKKTEDQEEDETTRLLATHRSGGSGQP